LIRDGGLNVGTSRLSLFDANSGEALYREEKLGRYSVRASPVAAGEHVYLATEEGEVIVVRRGAPFEIVAVNPMGETIIATPAIAGNEIYLRTRNSLFCIAAPD